MNNLLILLDQWQSCPFGDIWQFLEIFSIFVVIAGEILLKPSKDAHPTMPRAILPDKELCYKVSLMLTLGNFNLDHYLSFIRYLKVFHEMSINS